MTIFFQINCLFNRLNFDFVGQIMNKKFLKKKLFALQTILDLKTFPNTR